MFALIKYGVGCTLSIKHTLLDWSWKLVPRCELAGWSTSGPVLFCLSCFCMGVHARWFRTGMPDACRRVAFVRAGRDGAHWVGGQVSLARFRWFRAHFCHRALAAAQTNFPARFYPGALPSLLAYLTMQRSSFICCAQLFCRLLWSTRHTLQTGCF